MRPQQRNLFLQASPVRPVRFDIPGVRLEQLVVGLERIQLIPQPCMLLLQ